MKKQIAAVVVLSLVTSTALFAGIGGKKSLYVGGTVAGLGEKTEGRLETANDTALTFIPDKKGGPVSIRYKSIKEIEYGQKAGRRVGMAIMISPIALLSKKRNHFLTITYTDAAKKEQAGVFELGKDIVRTTLKIIETRSGKQLTFQDDEARKSLGGGK